MTETRSNDSRILLLGKVRIPFSHLLQLDPELYEIACVNPDLAALALLVCSQASARDAESKELKIKGAKVLHPSVWQAILDAKSLCERINSLLDNKDKLESTRQKKDSKNQRWVRYADNPQSLRQAIRTNLFHAQIPRRHLDRMVACIIETYCPIASLELQR